MEPSEPKEFAMIRKRLLHLLLLNLMLILCAAPGFGTEKKSLKEKYNLEFVAAPLVVFNPNFGNGGGVMGMALFDLKPEDEQVQSSSLMITGLYSDRESHFVGMGGNLLPSPDWRYKAGIATGGVKSQLDIDLLPQRADFTTSFDAIYLEGQYQFMEDLFAGLKVLTKQIDYDADNQAGAVYLLAVGAKKTTSTAIGPVMSYDTRDNRFFPFEGVYSEFSFFYNAEALGSDIDYYILEGFLNGYKQYRPGHVIAGRLYGRATPDNTPYADLSTLGQRSDLRGYVAGEHIGQHLVSAQLEYRWHFREKWALVGFIGEAALWNNGDLDRESFYTSGGGGLRYTLSTERRVNFRVDYAVGEGNSDGFYVGLQESF